MFDLFRSREKSVRILLGALLGLVALSMLIYLIPGGTGGAGSANQNVVAAVGDDQVTTVDVQRAVQNITRNQSNLPKGILAMYIPSLVSQLIEAKAMAYKAREMGLRVSDEELADAIQSEVTSQLGGKFDLSIYQAVLAQQGMTTADYEKQRRDAMLGMRLENLEMQSLIVSDQDAKAEYARKNLKVGLQYVAFEAKDFTSRVNKDPAAVKAYFDKNRILFRTPEKRDFDLVVGTTPDFVQSAKISDSDLQKQYQDNIDSYTLPERVKVRHILIKTQGKPKEDAPKLKAKAEDILKQLQHGGDFAELAKKNSEDPGSGLKGGELG
ncbi:MAG: SurA N-terminal domain-containing protein, partial [Bryobacteraceae bacterium]